MKLAIMQPYFFPYLGYFQLIHAIDTFVAYDDVAYIKQGWINRNYILTGRKPARFTVPVAAASSFCRICDTKTVLVNWQKKFLRSIQQAYVTAPMFHKVYTLVESVVMQKPSSIAELALTSITAVMNYICLERTIRPTSRIYTDSGLKGQARILDICQKERADTYINLPGGRKLYEREAFAAQGVTLCFLQPGEVHYQQFGSDFIPNLSILDVLMFNEPEEVCRLLQTYIIVI